VVWVEGNHDRGLTDVMSHLVGVKVYEQYEWEFEGRCHLAIHGHQFDRFAINNLLLSKVGTLLHLQLQKLDFKGKAFSRFLDRANARWLRLSAKVASGAILHARMHHADRVFCGHTHQAQSCERDGVAYYNSGSWTDSPPTYLTIDSEGVRVHEYRDQSEVKPENGNESKLAELADESSVLEEAEYENVG
jgi:predicted phosphodiesterase